MIRVTVTRSGGGLKPYQKIVGGAGRTIGEAVGAVIRNTWAAYVPVDTGALRASIYSETADRPGYAAAATRAHALRPHAPSADPPPPVVAPLVVWVGSAVAYALYVEYGTSRMPARPAFTPALELGRRVVAKLGADALKVPA